MKKTIPIVLPTLEHEFFFKYLLVSPSYRFVCELVRAGKSVPKKYVDVFNTYKIVGDITKLPFALWWESHGYKCFNVPVKHRIYFDVDTALSKKDVVLEFKNLIDELYQVSSTNNDSIIFLANKVRIWTLNSRLLYLIEKANDASTDSVKRPGWKLFDFADLSSKNFLKARNKRTSLNVDNRTYLTMLTSRYLRESFNIAENAARGVFPSLKNVDADLNFDYMFIDKFFGYGSHNNFDQKIRAKELNSLIAKHIKKLWDKETSKYNERQAFFYKRKLEYKKLNYYVNKAVKSK